MNLECFIIQNKNLKSQNCLIDFSKLCPRLCKKKEEKHLINSNVGVTTVLNLNILKTVNKIYIYLTNVVIFLNVKHKKQKKEPPCGAI